jgi:predicted esterase
MLMKYYYLYFLLFISPLLIAQQTDFSGLYSGNFKHGKFHTDIEFDIKNIHDRYQIKFNSLSQNAFGIPAGDIRISRDTIHFALQSDYYKYEFSCTPFGENKINGALSVDGHRYDFKLNKQTDATKTAVKTKDIRLRSQDLLLYGTIYYPERPNGKAIYLVTSSGDQDRSASRAEALLFAKAGYISFHMDKRGTGISDGNWELATIPELCEDDLHALEFLHQSEKIDYADIGIKGSSQGATKVPYILQKQPKLAFGIAVSCPASTLLESDLNYWRNKNMEHIGKEYIDVSVEMQNTVFQYIASNISKQTLEDKIEQNKSQPWFHHIWIPELDQVEFDKKLNYSPLPYFKNNNAPMLVIEGTQDMIIPSSSLNDIKKVIGSQRNKKTKFISLKGADHQMMLQEVTDFPYWTSLHPDYIKTMFKWIRKL